MTTMSLAQTPINPNDVTINPEYADMVPPLTEEEYTRLKDSIKEVGLYERIKINQDNIILDGHHRFKACLETGVMPRFEPKHFNSKLDEKIYVIESNVIRRQLTTYQKTFLGKKLEPLISEKNRQKMLSGNPIPNLEEGKEWERTTDAIVAKKMGLGKSTYQTGKKILQEGSTENIQDFKEGKAPSTIIRDMNTITFDSETAPPLPDGVYDIFYVDPPWRYDFSETRTRAIETNYPTMTLEDICDLEIPSSENSVLFLWATNPKLEEALQVIKSWGFTYKTNLAWIKDRIGMGYWFRGQHELLLVATKGKYSPPEQSVRRSGVLESPRRDHSQKPDELYKIIETYFPNGKYIELFARNTRPNWSSWGNEV